MGEPRGWRFGPTDYKVLELLRDQEDSIGEALPGLVGKWVYPWGLTQVLAVPGQDARAYLPTVARSMERLAERGWLTEPEGPVDQIGHGTRRRHYQLTVEGLEALEAYRGPRPVKTISVQTLLELADLVDEFLEVDDRETYGRLYAAALSVRTMRLQAGHRVREIS